MDDPNSLVRRTLLKAGAVTLATPVAAAIAQPAAAVGHQEAKSFDLWVISDQPVGTERLAFLQNLDPLQHRQHFVDPSEFLPRFAFRLAAIDFRRVYHLPALIVQHPDATPL